MLNFKCLGMQIRVSQSISRSSVLHVLTIDSLRYVNNQKENETDPERNEVPFSVVAQREIHISASCLMNCLMKLLDRTVYFTCEGS